MVRIPPLLPPPGRPQRNFRIPPPPLIKSPASGLAINALCNSLYASSGRSVVICFVNVGVSMKSVNDYTPLGDSCKESEAERRVPRLELLRALEEADDIAILSIRWHPVPGFRREAGVLALMIAWSRSPMP